MLLHQVLAVHRHRLLQVRRNYLAATTPVGALYGIELFVKDLASIGNGRFLQGGENV